MLADTCWPEEHYPFVAGVLILEGDGSCTDPAFGGSTGSIPLLVFATSDYHRLYILPAPSPFPSVRARFAEIPFPVAIFLSAGAMVV